MTDDTTKERPGAQRGSRVIPTVQVLFSGEQVIQDAPVVLPPGETRLGRALDGPGGLLLSLDGLVSRHHATVHRSGRTVSVVDAGSRHGVWVDGVRVRDAVLRDGAVLRLGDSFLVYRQQTQEGPDEEIPELLGAAPTVRRLRRVVSQVARSEASVLLLGASGSGKGASAKAIHRMSRRRGPFVSVNCAAIPDGLAESMLFGHRAGAFTGASQRTEGFFQAASGGTLFIDEVGELPLSVQPKLLHVLDNGLVLPVGEVRPVQVDVRVVAATAVDLVAGAAAGSFRSDLYARLAEVVVRVPSMQDRVEDVLMLLQRGLGEGMPPLSADLVALLLYHPWPLNVREVQKIATSLRVLGVGAPVLLPELVRDRLDEVADLLAARTDPSPEPMEVPVSTPEAYELTLLLELHQGVVSEVARATGRSRRQVYRWLHRHGLKPEDYRTK